jgi:hypothetical protein
MWIWIGNTAFSLANLRICNLRTGTPQKFSDLVFADKSLQTLEGGLYYMGVPIFFFFIQNEANFAQPLLWVPRTPP